MRTFVKTLVLAASVCCVWASVASAAPVKIGMLVTTSGPLGTLGQDEYDGFMLAVEHGGGKLGGTPVEIFKKDDQNKPDVASQIVQELIEKDRVSIIAGVTGSNIMMAIHKKVVDTETILISTLPGPSPMAGAGCSPSFFATSWQNEGQAENAGQIATLKGFKKMYVLAPNYQAGKDVVVGFNRYYKGEVVAEVYPQFGQLDFAAEIAEIRAAKPDGVFIFFPGAMGVSFIKQYFQAGMMGKIPLISCATDATTLPAIGDAAIGLITGSPWEAAVDNPTSNKFEADFTAKYKRAPSYFAALAYDGANLIGSALRKTKGNVADKKALIAALKEADFPSVRGTLKFNNNHFPIADWYMFEVVRDPKTGKPAFAFRAKSLVAHKDAYGELCPMK